MLPTIRRSQPLFCNPARRSLGRLTAAFVSVALVAAACSDSTPSTQVSSPTTAISSTTISEASTQNTSPATTVSAATPLQTQLAAAFEAERPDNGGVAALLTIDGVTTTAAVGDANAEGDPLTVGHQFRVGSVSKPVVATLVLQLVQDGLVDLDDLLADHLPTTAVGGDVTIEQLLAHRSGIPDYLASPAAPLDGPLDELYTPDQVVNLVTDMTPNPPDSPFAYSNTNYILLGQLIEAVDDRSLNESLAARITGPLGMDATFFGLPDWPAPTNLAGAWADGYVDGDPEAPYAGIETMAWAAGTLISNLEDMATFLEALGDGRLLDPAEYNAMTDFEANPVYALGIGEMSLGDLPAGAGWGHGGSIPGYRSLTFHAPESGDVLVVLTNTESVEVEPLAIGIAPGPIVFDNDPPGELGQSGDEGEVPACLAELGLDSFDGLPDLDDFPATEFGETVAELFDLLTDGDETARAEFAATRILTEDEIEEDPLVVEDVTGFLGDLQTDYQAMTIFRIVEVDPLTFAVILERGQGEPAAWVLGTELGDEDNILNLCTHL